MQRSREASQDEGHLCGSPCPAQSSPGGHDRHSLLRTGVRLSPVRSLPCEARVRPALHLLLHAIPRSADGVVGVRRRGIRAASIRSTTPPPARCSGRPAPWAAIATPIPCWSATSCGSGGGGAARQIL